MSLVKVAQILRERLGAEGADAVVEALDGWMADERRELISRADEKVEARYESIHRRVHEDIAGVEIRLTARMADLESRLGQRMSDLESRSLRWLVTALVLNAGLMLLTGWASKHLF